MFAFVFAPAGAALGHVALSQIKQRGQRGRERAIVGLTVSYVIIVLAVIALVIWLLTANGSESPSLPSSTTATQTTTRRAPPPPPRTTVITPPPVQRPTVRVEELRVGDCVEVQQTQPDPTKGPRNQPHPHLPSAVRGPRRRIPGRPDLVDQLVPWADTVQ